MHERAVIDVDAGAVPNALAELHARTPVGETVAVTIARPETQRGPAWLGDVIEGGGFSPIDPNVGSGGGRPVSAVLRRERTLADTVAPGMRLLVVGLNPSLYAADAGVGFARPGNRFWPAALAAGICRVDREPRLALRDHGMGMTDLVKRATARADVLQADEYAHGRVRLERLVAWLAPRVVCVVGLAGWRSAVDRTARPGQQPGPMAGAAVYLMPSTSGVNASSSLASLTDHLRAAAMLAG